MSRIELSISFLVRRLNIGGMIFDCAQRCLTSSAVGVVTTFVVPPAPPTPEPPVPPGPPVAVDPPAPIDVCPPTPDGGTWRFLAASSAQPTPRTRSAAPKANAFQ